MNQVYLPANDIKTKVVCRYNRKQFGVYELINFLMKAKEYLAASHSCSFAFIFEY